MGERRLWIARVEFDVVVEAASEHEAYARADVYSEVELDNLRWAGEHISSLRPVRELAQLPTGWRSAIPWGSDGDDTCAERLADDGEGENG